MLVVLTIIPVAPLVFVVRCVRSIAGRRGLRTRGHRAWGVVVDVGATWVPSRSNPGSGQYVHHPVVRYRGDDGYERQAVSEVGTRRVRFRPGEQIVVVYDPANPDRVRPEAMLGSGGFGNWLGLVLSIVLFLALAAGAATFWYLKLS
ncbi:DUF3592 domain-containing protein [Actinomadura atramentaria]|uniref:DUF3592 domain-containing protein n=1 Tax=Actinomadura atramentaria TaxID=1990 RepID=UPI001469FB54|nr:DUF3592 domain-containing protein [Actinomadura atramentaria]